MDLLTLLHETSFWVDTFNHMRNKRNLKTTQLQELEYLQLGNFYDTALTQIKNGEYIWSTPIKHLRNKTGTTKKRVVYIHSIQDRVLLGVLYRACSEYFKAYMSDSCFSYRKGVKTLNAIDYLIQDKCLFKKYGVKLDISSYFNSVAKDQLVKMIHELFDYESPMLLKLITDLMLTDKVLFNGEEIEEYKSLIPGCALSSFFANYCLKDLDHYIAEELGLTYARYSDDIILFADTKEEIEHCLTIIQNKLNTLGLKINPNKYEWYEPHTPITFLGLKIYENENENKVIIDISDNCLHKVKRRIRHAAKMARMTASKNHKDAYNEARKLLKQYNHRTYKCYIEDSSKYGWGYYAFRYINTIKSLRNIDQYLADRVRYVITGKNNKANLIKVSKEQLQALGYVPLVEMYNLFNVDFDVYCDQVYLM